MTQKDSTAADAERAGDKKRNNTVFYRSTRGSSSSLKFVDAVLCGLADDGGLLVPERVPVVEDISSLRGLSYRELCYEIFRLYVTEEEIPEAALIDIIRKAYRKFRCSECVGYRAVNVEGKDVTLMELFHGPTFAFKDFALQLLGGLIEWILIKRNDTVTILGATSGDTGSAAIAGLGGINNVRCCILYPEGKTSKIQELQMITTMNNNVQCLALEGAFFDDCQRIVKDLFESPLKQNFKLSAVNSINWARILAQTVYYWHSSLKFQQAIDVVVPTGNFGNALAAYYAKLSGAPIRRVIIAANSNDCLPRFLDTGKFKAMPVVQTMSPSMDIQLSSNFERGIFLCTNQDPKLIRDLFTKQLPDSNSFEVNEANRRALADTFWSFKASEEETAEAMRMMHRQHDLVVDPHTAVGIHCCALYIRKRGPEDTTPVVVASTAHCGKFPESVAKVMSQVIADGTIPEELAKLQNMPTKYKKIEATTDAVAEFLKTFAA